MKISSHTDYIKVVTVKTYNLNIDYLDGGWEGKDGSSGWGSEGGGWIGRLGERERRWKNENVSILRCIKQEWEVRFDWQYNTVYNLIYTYEDQGVIQDGI